MIVDQNVGSDDGAETVPSPGVGRGALLTPALLRDLIRVVAMSEVARSGS